MRLSFYNNIKSILLISQATISTATNNRFLKRSLFFSLALSIVTIFLNVMIPFLFRDLIRHLKLDISASLYRSLLLVLLYTGFWSLRQVTVQLREIFCFPIIEKLLNIMIFNLIKNSFLQPGNLYSKIKIEKVVDSIIRTQEEFSDLFSGLFLYIIPTFLEIIVILIIIGIFFPNLFCIVFGFFILLHICFTVWGLGKTSFLRKLYTESRNSFQFFLVDKLLNLETVKIFSQEDFEIERSAKYLEQYEKQKVKADIIIESIRLGQGLILGFLVVCSIIIGTFYVKSLRISVEDLILINFYFVQLVGPLGLLGMAMKDVKRGMAHLESMISLINDLPTATIIKSTAQSMLSKNKDIFLEFKNVWFETNDKEIIQDVSFKVKGKGIIGIIGKTGSGKSTIAKLIFGLLSPTKGHIFLNKKDIKHISDKDLKKSIGYVPQHPAFFNDSIYQNLLYSKESSSMKEIKEVIERVCLSDVIDDLPDKYHTVIGKNGVNLSGGQIQLLALARVLLRKPKLYIFDEITSGLDLNTQEKIAHLLQEIAKEALVIIISHRMSLIQDATQIIFVSKGRCVEKKDLKSLSQENLYERYLNNKED
jgi:ABC-type multidrug transport system fused ATPase/permease subunit